MARYWVYMKRGWGIALALSACLFIPNRVASAGDYAWWPLDDGEGFEARNLVEGGEPGYIFDADIGGLGEDGSVWVKDPDRGTVLGLAGTSAWVEAGFIPVMDLENDFTWSFWARQPPEQASPSNDIIIGNRWGPNGSDTSPREFIKFTPNRFEIHYNGQFENDFPYGDTDIPSNNQWIYNSVVKDGDSLSYYRNGQLRNSRSIRDSQVTEDPLPLAFGGQNDQELWRGSLSDVQLYTSALTPEQLTATQNGNLAEGAELYARYKLDDGDDSDIAVGTGPGAVNGGALIIDPFAGLNPDGSVWVDDPERGTVLGLAGTWVDAGEIPIMDLENDFTWTFWSKSDPAQAAPNNNIIIGNRTDFDGTDTEPLEYIKFTANQFEYRMDGDRNNLQYGRGSTNIPNNDEWIHHTAVKDGDQMSYYRDGILSHSRQLVSGQLTEDPMPFALGGQAAPDQPGNETWQGYLSDVRLFDNPLTAKEVAELAGVTPPIEPGDCNMDGVIDAADLSCASTIEERDIVLAELNTLPGDLNGDGQVAFSDFQVLNVNFGDANKTAYSDGDINLADGPTFADFQILNVNFGKTPAAAAATVPEPSAGFLVALGMLGLGLRRRPR